MNGSEMLRFGSDGGTYLFTTSGEFAWTIFEKVEEDKAKTSQ